MKNPFKFNLVIFNDGTYGVRRGFFSHEYIDINNPRLTWVVPDSIKKYCSGTLQEATLALTSRNLEDPKPLSSKFI